MKILVRATAQEASNAAADRVTALVRRKPDAVLGLASGSTPVLLYRELVRKHREEGFSFRGVSFFSLDEYLGIPVEHPLALGSFLRSALLNHIDADEQRVFLAASTPDYEQAIARAGGIDLQILGIGGNGHIAFNEPGSDFASRTRVVTLSEHTRLANSGAWGGLDSMPRQALTMGIGTILEARACLLLAFGKGKAEVVARALHGPVTQDLPASVLQRHRDVAVVLDEDAACSVGPAISPPVVS